MIKYHFNPQDNVKDYTEFLFKEIMNQKSCDELEKILRRRYTINIKTEKIDRDVLKDVLWEGYYENSIIYCRCN